MGDEGGGTRDSPCSWPASGPDPARHLPLASSCPRPGPGLASAPAPRCCPWATATRLLPPGYCHQATATGLLPPGYCSTMVSSGPSCWICFSLAALSRLTSGWEWVGGWGTMSKGYDQGRVWEEGGSSTPTATQLGL